MVNRIIGREVDKALELSNKRREQFRKQFSIFKEVLGDNTTPLDVTTPESPMDATSGIGGDAENPTDTGTGVPPAPGEEGGMEMPGGATGGAGGADGSDIPPPEEGGDDPDGGMGGGSGFGGFGGFGGGGGGGGGGGAPPPEEGGDDPDGGMGGGSGFGGFGGGGGGGGGGGAPPPSPDGTPENTAGPVTPQTEGDPIENMVSNAKELLGQTKDLGTIVKSLKGQLQNSFEDPENAIGVVKALYDTNNPSLQAVAEQLYLFIKTTPPKQ